MSVEILALTRKGSKRYKGSWDIEVEKIEFVGEEEP